MANLAAKVSMITNNTIVIVLHTNGKHGKRTFQNILKFVCLSGYEMGKSIWKTSVVGIKAGIWQEYVFSGFDSGKRPYNLGKN